MTIPTSTSAVNSLEDKRNDLALSLISNSLQKILDAFPLPTLLLDIEERILKVNKNFIRLFSFTNVDHLIGKKPEEIFNCIYATDTISECLVADHCNSCGSNLIMNGGNLINQKFTERCNLNLVDQTGHIDELHNMKVSTSPFALDGEQFFLFSISDISNEVRRKLLDRIFFHDVLNKAGNILGILDVLNLVGNDDEKSDELYESLKNTSQDLINEIKYQRDLSSAENNELTPVFSPTSSLEILLSTKNEIVNSDVAFRREIHIALSAIDCKIYTDGVLLRRVMLNMLKNALEATHSGGKVVMGCEPLDTEKFRFWVHNDEVIPNDIQIQLFNKSTSTKGCNRGLGTFSMRLFGEKYLKGKVKFISSEEAGTLFMIDIPIK